MCAGEDTPVSKSGLKNDSAFGWCFGEKQIPVVVDYFSSVTFKFCVYQIWDYR